MSKHFDYYHEPVDERDGLGMICSLLLIFALLACFALSVTFLLYQTVKYALAGVLYLFVAVIGG